MLGLIIASVLTGWRVGAPKTRDASSQISQTQRATEGSGKLSLRGFYYDNEKEEYATGTYMWPDGFESIIALVRT